MSTSITIWDELPAELRMHVVSSAVGHGSEDDERAWARLRLGSRECRTFADEALTVLSLLEWASLLDHHHAGLTAFLARLKGLQCLDVCGSSRFFESDRRQVKAAVGDGALHTQDCMSSPWACLLIADISPVQSCPWLLELHLTGCSGLKDIGPLASCPQLRELYMEGCRSVEDIGPLASCVHLRKLDLGGCVWVNELTALVSCTALEALTLCACAYANMHPLSVGPAASLRRLHLCCEGLGGADGLCCGLHRTDVADPPPCWRVQADLADLSGLTGLCSLTLPYGALDIAPLASMRASLHYLFLRSDHLVDVTPLTHLHLLRHLVLLCPSLRDLRPLAALTAATQLRLTCRRVVDIRPLSSCTSLTELTLSRCNHLVDVTPIAALTSLRVVSLWCCTALRPVDVAAALKDVRSLTHVDLRGSAGFCDLDSYGGGSGRGVGGRDRWRQVAVMEPLAPVIDAGCVVLVGPHR